MDTLLFEDNYDDETKDHDKLLILIIYDMPDNKRRTRFFKFLQRYGFSVQKSAFEARLTKKKYQRLLEEIPKSISSDDNVRVYKLKGYGEVTTFGKGTQVNEEIIII